MTAYFKDWLALRGVARGSINIKSQIGNLFKLYWYLVLLLGFDFQMSWGSGSRVFLLDRSWLYLGLGFFSFFIFWITPRFRSSNEPAF